MKDWSGINIDLERDRLFDDLGLKRLKESYMADHEISPQERYAFVSKSFSSDEEHAQRLYDHSSKHWLSYATPELAYGKNKSGLPISCFLTYLPDTSKGLIDTLSEVNTLSMLGGGVGVHMGIRSADNKSTGIIPHLKTYDSSALAYKQGSTRRGSYAVYLDISHPEIIPFIEMRKATGDPNIRCANLNHGVNITDDFMQIIENCMINPDFDDSWNLIDPNSKEVISTVSAKHLWQLLIETRHQRGEPYLHFIDTANRAMAEFQKELGLKINGSNLCFSGDTLVAVADGRNAVSIKDLANESNGILEFPVYSSRWNDNKKIWVNEIKSAVAFKSGTQQLVKVTLSDGSSFRCTEDHRIALSGGGYIEAGLSLGKNLQPFYTSLGNTRKYRHINSFSNGHAKQHSLIFNYYKGEVPFGYHIDHIENIAYDGIDNLQVLEKSEHLLKTGQEMSGKNNAIHKIFDVDTYLKNRSITTTLSGNGRYLGLSNLEIYEYARSLYEIGAAISFTNLLSLDSRMPKSFSKNRFGGSLANLKYMVINNITPEEYVKDECIIPNKLDVYKSDKLSVISIDFDEIEDVFDLTVSDNHNFNIITSTQDENYLECSGILVHNCQEIELATNEERTAVCCLSSLNLDYYDLWKDDHQFYRDVAEMLDNVLTKFIDTAPPELHRAINSATRERAIGIGVMGFHSYLQSKNIPFECAMAKSLNMSIFKNIKRHLDLVNEELAKERGECPDAIGYGKRFSYTMAVAPNASSSILMGNTSPGIEPFRANAYRQDTLSGFSIYKNRWLDKLLRSKSISDTKLDDIWKDIIAHDGSVQHLEILTDDEKDVFKTALEIDQRWVIDLATDRAPEIDQGQSVNVFFRPDAHIKYLHAVHFSAWKKGLKGLYYLRSDKLNKADKVSQQIQRNIIEEIDLSSIVDDSECLACQ